MIKRFKFVLNLIIMGSLILVFEHISKFSYFAFLYPWIGLILISFTVYFAFTIPYFLKKPRGLNTLMVGIIFIIAQYITATWNDFKTSAIFIIFIVIISIVVQNSDTKKLRVFLRIITYCCLANLIYAIFTIITGTVSIGATFRIGGLDGTPVLFGYNMLLGFWLVKINSIVEPNLNKSNLKFDKYFAFAFILGILLSQSRGAIFGLIMGLIFIFLSQKKINVRSFFRSILFLILIIISLIIFYDIYYNVLGLKRIIGTFDAFSHQARFILWKGMLEAYFYKITFLKFFFGGGQGYGTDLISRGVHSDHLKLLFDHGIIGLSIYYFKVLSCLRWIKEFNIYIIGFIVSTFASGIFYTNFGSITNSFGYILTIIVLSNYGNYKLKN